MTESKTAAANDPIAVKERKKEKLESKLKII